MTVLRFRFGEQVVSRNIVERYVDSLRRWAVVLRGRINNTAVQTRLERLEK
jgi:hypothetical protein